MGATLSTALLIFAAATTGVFSFIAANEANKQVYTSSELWAIGSAITAFIAFGITVFIVVKSRTGASEVTSMIEEFAFGVMLAYIGLTVAMVTVGALNSVAAYEASKQRGTNALWYNMGAGAVSVVAFILAIVTIVFLV